MSKTTPCRLWDKEPRLFEAARSVTISQIIPAGDPQPAVSISLGASALNLSTQKMKVTLWGPAEELTLSLGKTDVHDRRIVDEPFVRLERIRQTFAEGRVPPINYYTGLAAYDFPCPKPVGQVIIKCDDFRGVHEPVAITNCSDGTTTVKLEKGNAKACITYLPMMDCSNIIAISVKFEGLTSPASVRLYRHNDTTTPRARHHGFHSFNPEPFPAHDYSKDKHAGPVEPPTASSDKKFFWIEQVLPADRTFPHGFWIHTAGRIVGEQVEIESVTGEKGLGTPLYLNAEQQKMFDNKQGRWGDLPNYAEIRDAPGSAVTAKLPAKSELEFLFLVNVVTMTEAAGTLDEAKQRLALAEKKGFEQLRADNAKWFEQLYNKRENGRVFTGTEEYTRQQIPQIYNSWTMGHKPWCLPNPKRYECNTDYAWMEQDYSNWHGFLCYDELYATSEHVCNQSERWSYYYELVDFWWPAARQYTKEVFGLNGTALSVGYLPPIEPTKYFPTHTEWDFCMELTAQIMKVLWERFDYTGDEKYLRDNLYEKMRDVAIFYSSYVTKAEDGYYHIIPTNSAEHYGWTENMARNKDTTSALCMFKWQLNTAAAAAELLGVDKKLRKQWRQVAANLLPYPRYQTDKGPVFSDMPGTDPLAIDYNFVPGTYPCLMADEINLDSPQEQKDMMLLTAELMLGEWARRFSGNPEILLGKPYKSKRCMPERLLNSRSGRIHLFCAIEPNESIAFRNFQARGGFLVTAECIDGQTTYLEITARRNIKCHVMNPWPGKNVKIFNAKTKKTVRHSVDDSKGQCLIFKAEKGKKYLIAEIK